MNEVNKTLGRVGLSLKGEYSNVQIYKRLDVAHDSMGSYISLQDNNVGHPLSDPAWWMPQSNSQPLLDAENKALAAAKKAEDVAAKAEGTDAGIANAETLRVTAETERIKSENLRVVSEKRRSDAEVLRKQDEDVRKTNETSRNQSEEGRASEESKRVNAESLRVAAEQRRTIAEDARKISETERGTAEQGRVTAESERVKTEQSRAAAEAGRTSAENDRVTNETLRATGEGNRIKAEQARATAEGERASAEQSRVTAEQNRVTEFNQSKQSADAAATKANDAAKIANDAAANATTATGNMQKYVTEYNVSRLYPTKGIGGTDKYDLLTAIAALNADPTVDKSVGIKCSFLTSQPKDTAFPFEAYQYQGASIAEFADASKWVLTRIAKEDIAVGPVGVVSQKQIWTKAADCGYDYRMTDIKKGVIPQYFIDEFLDVVMETGTYNASTGYFEMNELVDISYEEAKVIMRAMRVDKTYPRYADYLIYNCKSTGATLFPRTISYTTGYPMLEHYIGFSVDKDTHNNSHIECLISHYQDKPENDARRWRTIIQNPYCMMGYKYMLKKWVGIDAKNRTSLGFERNYSLEVLRMINIKVDVNLCDSARLTVDSVKFLIDYETSTKPITITLHQSVYAKASIDEGVKASLAAHPNVSLASV